MKDKQLFLCRNCGLWYENNLEGTKVCSECKAELEHVPIDFSTYASWNSDGQKAFQTEYLNEREKAIHSFQYVCERNDEKEKTGKQKWKAIILMAIIWMASFGEGLEWALQEMSDAGVRDQISSSAAYNLMGRTAFFYSVIDVGFAALVMMAIPLICRLVHRKRLPHQGGKWLCAVNSIILLFLPMTLGYGLINFLDAIFFYFINKWFFVAVKPTASLANG